MLADSKSETNNTLIFNKRCWYLSKNTLLFFFFEIGYLLSWKRYAICKLNKIVKKDILFHYQIIVLDEVLSKEVEAYGQYTCSPNNGYTFDLKPCVFTIKPSDR